MPLIALGLFAVAAVFGLYMASRIFRGVLPPVAAALLHGLLAASGLVILLYAAMTGGLSQGYMIATGILVVAALGGFFLASYHLRKLVAPKAIVVMHALAAVAGVGTLAASVVRAI